MADEDLRWCDVCDDCSHYKAVGDEKYQCTLEGGRCRGYFAYKKLKAENAALRERLEKAVELPCKIGDRFYIVEYYPPEIIEEECCDFSFIELSKILLDNGCGVTYELGDNGCFFVTLDKNEAIRIYNQKKEEQND